MYEPKFTPLMNGDVMDLSSVRFEITSSRAQRRADDGIDEPLHIHEYTEIFLLRSGEISFFVGDNFYPVLPGEVVISRAKDVHRCRIEGPCVFDHYCLWIDAPDGSSMWKLLQSVGSGVLTFEKTVSDKLTELFDAFYKESRAGEPLERTIFLLRIISILTERSDRKREQISMPAEMKAILDDINENFASIKHIKELLARHFVSSATLNRWFREYLSVSPREYVESKKLSNAVKLLSAGASVTDACMRSGFSDCSHFIILFKKKFGKTPFRYKATHVYEL